MGNTRENTEEVGATPEAPGLDMDMVRARSQQTVALIVDDDADTVQLLKITLRREGINVIGAHSGQEALTKCVETNPNVILLDIMMPVMDGWETLDQLQHITHAPVVVISALGQEDALVRALAEGADDYIRKPFSAKEVVARVQAALRRQSAAEPINTLIFPDRGLLINLDTRQVWLHNEIVKLTPYEFSVLTTLAAHPKKPLAYEFIIGEVWGEYSPKVQNRLKWIVHQLRSKLESDPSNPRIIINHPKFGYQFSD